MELRDIEIFLTLAEELHFTRTAERLHVTQARVSQAIKKQERRIGAALFERDNRHVALTPIGQRLFDDIQPMYRGLSEGMDRARLAARGRTGVLRIGSIAVNLADFRQLFDAFAQGHPECEVQLRHVDFGDPFGRLRAGDIDIQIVWLPVREPDLTVGPVIYTEPIVLAVGATHPLAGRESVSYEDLADETVMGGARPDYWREILVPLRTPSGRLIRIGPSVSNFQEMIPILATGEAVSPVHAQAARYYARPDIAYVPIHDAPPARWGLIWRTGNETELIRSFAGTAHHLNSVEQPAGCPEMQAGT
ncbi:LysR family transcriptional regulator [Micromonospora sp. LH3U1]|uniref:LysR family transcriptional regulator n=1 Tax=Micromonospora sp. LH3U1 TaxID=3018339 RepID=UPI00234A862C|nr:LysR family transcriptional regulator [Micromonospora sp. LH3U1]WCN81753.1 LysR family transcriptional regulator [Micromonospora sp. LH3U1]